MRPESSVKIIIDSSRSNVEVALKKFKRICEAAGIVKEYRKRREYKKPSVRRKEKQEAAEKRKIKDMAKMRRPSKY